MKEGILLVEDDSTFNFITTKILEGLGVSDQIDVAMDGREALELLNGYLSRSRAMPRLILVDINMPVMDGFSFIEAFNQMKRVDKTKTTVAILSSSVSEFDRQRAETLGVKHFISKPVSEQDLLPLL